MSYRLSLRTAVIALGVTGAVLTPAAGAFATDEPTRAPSAVPSEAKPEPTVAPAEDTGPAPAPEGEIPRGGVAAGERPVSSDPGSNTALYGTAAGTVLLAAAGTYVLRRRAGTQRNG
ncbi:hypothetical protein [Streptomyces poonensis]|uniref:LPXTG cell wall anchor domain-containing protein n=1 Tax=Streptomyces poonensis TaxID=68255 RepID=A0A918Q437_9ACTN|nr:hypothetical protein [Streptomyces poonensis]GGZ31079.1 hypothetical protein GCM10010365_59560 [Streptomyces poonensis]GLJ88281.1 hypothetical protein GCM10017589_08810 [Streptomyces poonensis]